MVWRWYLGLVVKDETMTMEPSSWAGVEVLQCVKPFVTRGTGDPGSLPGGFFLGPCCRMQICLPTLQREFSQYLKTRPKKKTHWKFLRSQLPDVLICTASSKENVLLLPRLCYLVAEIHVKGEFGYMPLILCSGLARLAGVNAPCISDTFNLQCGLIRLHPILSEGAPAACSRVPCSSYPTEGSDGSETGSLHWSALA